MLPALILSTLCFAGSLLLAVRRGAETFPFAGLKLLLFLAFFVALWERARVS
jgi:hypothetical protein